jgi:oligosaccharide repeat unit polymerase
LIFTFAGFTGIFILTAWLRDAGGEIFIDAMIDNVSAYFFGYLSSFTQWIQVYNQKNILFGMVTFAGPADLLGLTERELGFYNEVSVLGESHTNIFTALRGIIHDFSIIGGFLYFGIFGFIGTMAYNACFNKRILWIIPLSIFYAFTIYSPLISIFNYNSILFSWIILGFTIIISPIFKRYMI